MNEKILVCLCIVFLLYTLKDMFFSKQDSFWNIKKIITNYFKMFNKCIKQLFMLFVFPIIYAFYICIKFPLNYDILNNINLFITILTSLFFAFVGFLCSINYEEKKPLFKDICDETFNLMCFEILCSIVIIILSFASFFIVPKECINNSSITNITYILSGIIYYLLIVTILNVFIILKRVERIFSINTDNNIKK